MGLSQGQRKCLAAVRKQLKSADWQTVLKGVAQLEAAADLELWAVAADDLSVNAQGQLKGGGGSICRSAKSAYRENLALHIACGAGILDELNHLELASLSFNIRKKSHANDLSPLARLTALVSLSISQCSSVSDLSPLRALTSLTTLNIAGTAVSDISALRSLTRLSSVNLSNCRGLRDLRPLLDLPDLAALQFAFPPSLQELVGLTKLAGLTTLRIPFGNTSVHDLGLLSALPSLTTLDLRRHFSVADFSVLASLQQLTDLNLMACTLLCDLSPLSGLASLTTLDLSSCKNIEDFSPLEGLTRLTQLDLKETRLDKAMLARLQSALPACQIEHSL